MPHCAFLSGRAQQPPAQPALVLLSLLNPAVARGAQAVFAAVTLIAPAFLPPGLAGRHLEIMTTGCSFLVEVGHDCAPFRPMGFGPGAVQ